MKKVLAVFFLVFLGIAANAGDLTQYPVGLRNSYINVNLGAGRIPAFPDQHPVLVHMEVGHELSRHVSAQITYARPFVWEKYQNRGVLTNIAGLTLRGTAPVSRDVSLFAQGGFALVTRSGLTIDGRPLLDPSSHGSVLVGTGIQFRLSRSWDLQWSALYSPPKPSAHQPYTILFSEGLVLRTRKLTPDQVAINAHSDAIFPLNVLKFSHSTDELGTGVNHFFSKKVPIFWGGRVRVHRGLEVAYERTVFHTRRLFALQVGASAGSYWSTQEEKNFWTFSVYPKLQFTPIRTKSLDLYAFYSIAGPTYVTQRVMDGVDTGRHFTFRDWLGVGCQIPGDRHLTMEVSIGHFSNGNLFPRNGSFMVPMTVSLGYQF